jgi:hypothetical protein
VVNDYKEKRILMLCALARALKTVEFALSMAFVTVYEFIIFFAARLVPELRKA